MQSCSHLLDPKSTQVYQSTQNAGLAVGRAWRLHTQPGRVWRSRRAELAWWHVRSRVARVWTAGARALGASTGFGLHVHARTALEEGPGQTRRPRA